MDALVIGLFSAVKWPTGLMFSFTGDTAAGFFSIVGIDLAGGIPLGVAVQYLIGLALGIALAAATSRVRAFRRASLKQAALLGILYIEVVSLPIAATAPIINNMTTTDMIQWFSLSLLMHPFYAQFSGLSRATGRGPMDSQKAIFEPMSRPATASRPESWPRSWPAAATRCPRRSDRRRWKRDTWSFEMARPLARCRRFSPWSTRSWKGNPWTLVWL